MDSLDVQTQCLQAYLKVRSHSTVLTASLSAEDCALQAAPFTSPAKWHLAHTSWFFETFVLIPHQKDYAPYNSEFQILFNSYYNGIGEQFPRPKRHLLSRPSFEQVMTYRQYVDEAMERLMERQGDSLDDLITLGLNHEQQHQELLLMDLKYCFFQNPLYPSYYPNNLPSFNQDSSVPELAAIEFISIDSGLHDFGCHKDTFHFDNETPLHQQYLQPYQLANRLVTNGEYLQFIEDGGYQQDRLWLSDGWAWLKQEKIDSPLYWIKKNDQWFEFTLHGLQPLDLYAVVKHVSFYEAFAYAQWSGARLATEFEWEYAANSQPNELNNLTDEVWQWTQSAYQPYPGFEIPDGAVGEYNGKFMCNQMVLRGGCELTPAGHTRPSYRNFFYPQDQWVMAGIRLAKDENTNR